MKKGASKSKGSGFEREISKALSLWLSENKNDDLFWRTSNSGGRFTSRFKGGTDTQNQSGDITSLNSSSEWFINFFSIECKFYIDINIWSIFTNSKMGLIEFWEQSRNDSTRSDKNPILIVKQNFKPILLITNDFLFDKFEKMSFKPNLIICNENSNMYVYKFTDFIENVNPIDLKIILENS